MIKLIIIGTIVGILNSLGIKLTIFLVVKYKQPLITSLSLLARLIIIFIIFYLFLNSNWKNAFYMLIGFSISKLFFILLEMSLIKKGSKNGNNSR